MPNTTRPRAVTLVDVAARAGVSRTTASDALRGHEKVSPATRVHVTRIARELGYRVNVAARNLRSRETGTLGLHLPEAMTRIGYYMEVAFGVLEACAAEGCDVTMITSRRYGSGSPLPDIDGVILSDPLVDDAAARALLDAPVPKLTFEHVTGAHGPGAVLSADHELHARTLLDHLWDQGARLPGMLASPPVTDWGARLQGVYRDWCVERGVEPRLVDRPFGSIATDWRGAIGGLVAAGTDAVLCGSVAAATAACDAIAERGLRVGSDVLVASAVDAPELVDRAVPVTAVDLRPRAAGAEAVRLLLRLIRGELADESVVEFPVEIRYRASSGSGTGATRVGR